MANCEICGKPCGFMGGGREPYTGKELFICNECGILFKKIESYKSGNMKGLESAVTGLKEFCINLELKSTIEEYCDKALKIGEQSAAVLDIKKREAEEKAEKIREIEAEYATRSLIFKETTGYEIDGYTIKKYCGIVSGEVVLGTGFMSEFSAGLSDFFGTQSNLFANKMAQAKQGALTNLKKNAMLKGANALIGVDFDYITFGNNILGVSANGTAVVIEEVKEVVEEKKLMRCPKCGQPLVPSKKEQDIMLCYNCKQKFRTSELNQ